MRKWYRTFRTALHALQRNVMRSILTMLGIIMGVAAVIAMMEIGSGSSNAIQSTITKMGANNLLIMQGTAASGGVSFGAGTTMTTRSGLTGRLLRSGTQGRPSTSGALGLIGKICPGNPPRTRAARSSYPVLPF